MTEHRTVIDVSTGERKIEEYYTQEEFLQKKCERLIELSELMASESDPIIGIKIYAEYRRVLHSVGPMRVGSEPGTSNERRELMVKTLKNEEWRAYNLSQLERIMEVVEDINKP